MNPKDKLIRGHDLDGGYYDSNNHWNWNVNPSTFVWDLPPGAADVGLEELRKARIKRQASTHIVLVPKLFTHLRKKKMIKCCYFFMDIAPVHKYWSSDQFESLTLGICFPFFNLTGPGNCDILQNCSLWKGRCRISSKAITWTEGIFCANFCSKSRVGTPCHRAYCGQCYSSRKEVVFPVMNVTQKINNALSDKDKMRLKKAWKKNHQNPTNYLIAKNADHLLVPF